MQVMLIINSIEHLVILLCLFFAKLELKKQGGLKLERCFDVLDPTCLALYPLGLSRMVSISLSARNHTRVVRASVGNSPNEVTLHLFHANRPFVDRLDPDVGFSDQTHRTNIQASRIPAWLQGTDHQGPGFECRGIMSGLGSTLGKDFHLVIIRFFVDSFF